MGIFTGWKYWQFNALFVGVLWAFFGAILGVIFKENIGVGIVTAGIGGAIIGVVIGAISGIITTWLINWAKANNYQYWMVTAVSGAVFGAFEHAKYGGILTGLLFGLIAGAIGGVVTIAIIDWLKLSTKI